MTDYNDFINENENEEYKSINDTSQMKNTQELKQNTEQTQYDTQFTNPYTQYQSKPYTEQPVSQQPGYSTPQTPQYTPPQNDDMQNGYYHHSYIGANSNGVNTQQPSNNPYSTQNQKPKENKVKMPKKALVAVIAICVLLSGAFGFGGTMLANAINKNDANADGAMVIHQVTADKTTETENLVDKSTSQITQDVADSVVEITTELMTTNSFYGQQISQGAGSGVIISQDGYVITNNHVIDSATKITVTLRSGDTYDAKLIGKDSEVDIALLKIDAKDLKVAVFGDSSELTVGDKAVAIGNPLGQLGGTVTDGIVSALDRTVVIDDKAMNLLQTDTAINPGNSGGGLFNGQGELIGVVVAKSSGETVEGLGFAIPINDVLDILSDLKEHGYVTGRPALGVTFVDLTNSMYAMYYFGNPEEGCYVYSINSGSNAEKAGLKVGDRVISVNGTEIKSSSDIQGIIKKLSVGDEVSLEVERSGQKGTIKVKLEEKVPDAKSESNNSNSRQSEGFSPFG